MNYRHSYHAGNHTEVFKHSVLVLLLQHLLKKPGPFMVLDTHAGAGLYDLTSNDAEKTGEAQDGIGRIIGRDVPAASAYLDLIRRLNPTGLRNYPGSPVIVQAFLREHDSLVACELRKDDAATLRRNFKDDRRVSAHCRDGYEAINAFLPLPTRRGLVFIDPPFERPDEFARLADGLNSGIQKWPTGTFLAWYPIKTCSEIRQLHTPYLPQNPPTLSCQLLRDSVDGVRLAGSGVIICNPPWRFENKLTVLCSELLRSFGAQAGTYTLDWWIRERG
jgi:23S rRNA (adenine2030-N6)-methyltransferase